MNAKETWNSQSFDVEDLFKLFWQLFSTFLALFKNTDSLKVYRLWWSISLKSLLKNSFCRMQENKQDSERKKPFRREMRTQFSSRKEFTPKRMNLHLRILQNIEFHKPFLLVLASSIAFSSRFLPAEFKLKDSFQRNLISHLFFSSSFKSPLLFSSSKISTWK